MNSIANRLLLKLSLMSAGWLGGKEEDEGEEGKYGSGVRW